jgi:hypothetical protein
LATALALVVVVTGGCAGGVIALAAPDGPGTSTTAPAAKPARPVHPAPTATTRQIGRFLASVPADGGASVALPDGRVLWTFGDTMDTGARNSAAAQSGATFTRLPGELLPHTRRAWYWGGQPVMDAGRVVILFGEMHADGGWGRQEAVVVATFDASTLALIKTTRLRSSADWGEGLVRSGGRWWLYGTRVVSDTDPRKVVSVRSAPIGSLADPSTWSKATPVLSASWGAGTTTSVVATSTGVLLATKRGDLLSDEFVISTATHPTGTYSRQKVIARPLYRHAWTYTAYLHPEQVHAPLRMVMTYAVNSDHASPAYHLYAMTIPVA